MTHMDVTHSIINFVIGLLIGWVIMKSLRRGDKPTNKNVIESPTQVETHDTPKHKFSDRDLFCAICLKHERFFSGGGSWSPDLCPCGSEDCVVWRDMSPHAKYRAAQLYELDEIELYKANGWTHPSQHTIHNRRI